MHKLLPSIIPISNKTNFKTCNIAVREMFGDLIDLSSPLPQVNANLTQSFETPTLEPQVFRKSAQFPVASLLDDDVSTISRDQPIEPEPMEDVQHSMPTSMQTAGDMGLQEQSASNVKETLQAPYMMEEEQTQEGSLARPALQPATEDQPQLQMSVVGADNTSLLTAGERRELLELRAMLSKVEASRDAVARDLGLSKGVIAGVRMFSLHSKVCWDVARSCMTGVHLRQY